MSPLRSSAGPATCRIETPSSRRMICASEVLPSPGGPASRTWSSASPRPFAASSAIASCSLTRSWPTKSASERGAERALELLLAAVGDGGREHAARSRRLPAAPGAPAPRPAATRRPRRAHARRRAATSRARRARRARASPSPAGPASSGLAELVLQLHDDPLGGLAADPGDRLEAGEVVARDRPAELVAGGEPETIASATFGPDPGDAEAAARRARAPRRSRSRRAAARRRGRGGRSRPSSPRRARARHARRRRDEVADAADVDARAPAVARARDDACPREARRSATTAPSAERRRERVADRDGERVGGVVGARRLVEGEDRLHHPLHLPLVGVAVAADRLLDPVRRVLDALDAGGRRGDEHGAARLSDGERDAGVGADVRLLQGDGIRGVLG